MPHHPGLVADLRSGRRGIDSVPHQNWFTQRSFLEPIMQKKGKSSDFRRLTSLLNLLIIVPIRTPPWKPHIKLATSNHKAKTQAALWGNVVLSNTICVAYLYGDKPIPVGLLPQQYTKQFDLCQGTPNPHRCEMVGGFYRCTLKIEDAVPVEVFTSFVLWSASKAAGL